jgi:DNA-binding MarR family transcriptional regulator
MIPQVRRFNRTVTQRIGALNDRFLARDRSLGEARLLWEIGVHGRDVRSLRADLELDSGYVSRLLRSLEAAGLVTVGPKESDRRVRIARLTPAGLAERTILDRRSDAVAASLLEHLGERQRVRLVEAMAEVERLLTAAMVNVLPVDPSHADAAYCLHEYFSDLNQRFEAGFDPALSKRMWVAPSARGLGVGRRLLTELETYAAIRGVRTVRLETNRSLTEAIGLYRSAGYAEVEPFNDETYAHHWFEKQLDAQHPSGPPRGSSGMTIDADRRAAIA